MSIIGPLNRTITRLGAAGVDTPRTDAELLLAHVLGLPRSRLLLAEALTPAQEADLEELVSRRMGREPLQHLLGTAVLGPAEVAVGPGVFVPRPETEGLLVLALDALRGRTAPLVVDLCTGSGALALAVHLERPDADVHAVEDDPTALGWARRNLARVTVHDADVTAPGVLADLDGTIDVVTANPPYVPDDTPVDPEVAADPRRAVFAGADGLAVIRPLAPLAFRLLRPGGVLVLEHDESHVDGVVTALTDAGFVDVVTHPDLAGRPRATTAHRPDGVAVG
jgi:release factor glutamine methyltransferase